jgi:anti-sigma regulatory factor (Ser/Thr protein kinase)
VTATDRGERARPLQPPYLVTTSTDRRGVSVGITADASTAVVEMAVHGPWSRHLGSQVAAGLRLCLAGPSASIIIDLHDVVDAHGASQPFWAAAWRAAGLAPTPVRLTLCLPTTTTLDNRLRRMRGPRPMLFATMSEARIATAGRLPRTHRLQTRLAPSPESVRAARDLVTHACHTWRLFQAEVHDARLIMSELATNAVEHARTNFVATVSRNDTRLHLAVRDGTAQFPHLSEPEPTDQQAPLHERGRGLQLVHATAAAWGAMPTRGGKVVWATIPSNSNSP